MTSPIAMRRVARFIAPHRRLFAPVIASILGFVAMQLCFPALIRMAIDSVTGKAGAWPIRSVLALFLAAVAGNAVAGFVSDATSAKLAQRVIFDLRRAMFAHLQRLPMDYMDKTHLGGIMARLQGDVNALQEFFETSIIAVGDLALLVGIVIVLFVLDWHLGLVAALLLPALAAIRHLWLPRARLTFARARDLSSIVNGALAENIAGTRVVIGARREAENLRRFTLLANESRAAQTRASLTAQVMTPIVDLLTGLAMVAILLGGALLVSAGRMDLGLIVAFIFYIQRFFDPVRTLAQQYTMLQRASAAAHRIFEVLDVPVTLEDRPDAIDPGAVAPSVDFIGVSFGYGDGRPVLHDLDLSIAPYETVALVGPTGSGKTSIAALIRRFYDVRTGSVRIGGHDVRGVTSGFLGRTVATVLQDPYLFSGTVLDNIRYARADAPRARLVEAARAVGADAFITALPHGYDTVIGQSGQSLSLGQRQLLSFARALVADPKILILDEATASIDSIAEEQIQQAMRVLRKGRTSIIIAHRLATVRDADRIIIVKDGRILEQGAPAALIARGGLYAQLHTNNHASFDDVSI